ncbi:hypothetical protein [Candidatus Ichthyocystis hellenicum]|uniref:hypothetical protein n=1 Tax=Candidatus Ichthyocystis hellenicum TaxID=1561003 RepID=UPI000B82CB74|nr:hypothetical protein [Candidatus Ichthyocystis hellenicum]
MLELPLACLFLVKDFSIRNSLGIKLIFGGLRLVCFILDIMKEKGKLFVLLVVQCKLLVNDGSSAQHSFFSFPDIVSSR